MRSATSHIQYLPQNPAQEKDAVVMPEEDALATTEEEEEQFNGMLNFEYNEEV